MLHGSSSALDDQLRIGGPFSVRGFDQGSVDMNPETTDNLLAAEGGITLGYRVAPALSCHLFFDSGALTSQALAKSTVCLFLWHRNLHQAQFANQN